MSHLPAQIPPFVVPEDIPETLPQQQFQHSRQGLALEIGEWAQGTCEYELWIATSDELLTVALQFLIVQQHLASQQIFNSKLDCQEIQAQLQRIQSSLDYITQINTHLTNVQKNKDDIRAKAKAMKAEIRSSLVSISEAFNRLPGKGSYKYLIYFEDYIQELVSIFQLSSQFCQGCILL